MGVWGPGSFENDDAAELLVDLASSADMSALLDRALGAVADASPGAYIELPEAACAVAAGATALALAGVAGVRSPAQLAEIAARWQPSESGRLVSRAIDAVARVREGSELQELWEAGGGAPAWLEEIDDLLARLDLLSARAVIGSEEG